MFNVGRHFEKNLKMDSKKN